jgi:hypothetical protein
VSVVAANQGFPSFAVLCVPYGWARRRSHEGISRNGSCQGLGSQSRERRFYTRWSFPVYLRTWSHFALAENARGFGRSKNLFEATALNC